MSYFLTNIRSPEKRIPLIEQAIQHSGALLWIEHNDDGKLGLYGPGDKPMDNSSFWRALRQIEQET